MNKGELLPWHPPDLSGWLDKCVKNVEWKRRYFILKGPDLFWFHSREAATDGRPPRGFVPLEGAAVRCRVAVNKATSKPYSIHLQLVTGAQGVCGRGFLIVAASSPEQQELWHNALCQAAEPPTPPGDAARRRTSSQLTGGEASYFCSQSASSLPSTPRPEYLGCKTASPSTRAGGAAASSSGRLPAPGPDLAAYDEQKPLLDDRYEVISEASYASGYLAVQLQEQQRRQRQGRRLVSAAAHLNVGGGGCFEICPASSLRSVQLRTMYDGGYGEYDKVVVDCGGRAVDRGAHTTARGMQASPLLSQKNKNAHNGAAGLARIYGHHSGGGGGTKTWYGTGAGTQGRNAWGPQAARALRYAAQPHCAATRYFRDVESVEPASSDEIAPTTLMEAFLAEQAPLAPHAAAAAAPPPQLQADSGSTISTPLGLHPRASAPVINVPTPCASVRAAFVAAAAANPAPGGPTLGRLGDHRTGHRPNLPALLPDAKALAQKRTLQLRQMPHAEASKQPPTDSRCQQLRESQAQAQVQAGAQGTAHPQRPSERSGIPSHPTQRPAASYPGSGSAITAAAAAAKQHGAGTSGGGSGGGVGGGGVGGGGGVPPTGPHLAGPFNGGPHGAFAILKCNGRRLSKEQERSVLAQMEEALVRLLQSSGGSSPRERRPSSQLLQPQPSFSKQPPPPAQPPPEDLPFEYRIWRSAAIRALEGIDVWQQLRSPSASSLTSSSPHPQGSQRYPVQQAADLVTSSVAAAPASGLAAPPPSLATAVPLGGAEENGAKTKHSVRFRSQLAANDGFRKQTPRTNMAAYGMS